jgi:hypothetical protein
MRGTHIGRLTAATVLAMIAMTVPVVHTATAQPATDATISTIRAGNGYDLYVNGTMRTHIASREVSSSIITAVTADGARAAIIPEHDGFHGDKLMLLDVASGALRTVATGPVTSVAFSSDGTRFAYAVAEKGGATIHTAGLSTVDRAVITVPGMDVKVLGWRDDAAAVFVVRYADRRNDGQIPADLVRVDLARAATTPVLAGDITKQVVYRDFRLVTVNGRQLLSFVRTGTAYACSDVPSEIVLARTDGTVERTFGRTADTYREATWSADGRQVAYTATACVTSAEKSAGKAAAARRAVDLAGTYVTDLASRTSTQVVQDVSAYRISSLDRGVVRLSSDRRGTTTIDAAAMARGSARPVRAADLESARLATDVTIQGRTNRAVQINQIYDTNDNFDGRAACGPTSSIMDMATYQLGEWGQWVNYGGTHWSPYGRYITDRYQYNGHDWYWTEPDFSGRGAWAGAYGYMVFWQEGTHWDLAFNFLNAHTGWARDYAAWNPDWVRGQLNVGNLVVAGGNVHGLSHIVLIKGYTDDGGFVVNDPFGWRSNGGPGGADQVYYPGSDMNIWHMVAN